MAAQAEVVRRGNEGFVSKHQLMIAVAPAEVWRAMTQGVSRWWDPAHTISGDAENLLMQTKVGGCFCEKLPAGKFEHLRIIVSQENQELRLRGGLGPLQSMGAAGTMSIRLTAIGESTRLDYKYAVSGTGDQAIAEAVDQVQLDQLKRLQQYVEKN